MGHALGATAADSALALAIPVGIELISGDVAKDFYMQGFRGSSLMVVITLMFGATLAYFHKEYRSKSDFNSQIKTFPDMSSRG